MSRPDWPHQVFAVQEVERRIAEGVPTMCVTSPTGGGKSTIIQRLCERAVERGHQAIVMTNRKLLTNQLAKGLSASGIHLGVRAATFEAWTDLNAPVQICSTPTEHARVIKRRERAIQNMATEADAHRDHALFPAQLVIVDEAHMNRADSTATILAEYREKHNATLVGVTATPLGISHLYDELIIAGKTSELRACGALVAARCVEPFVLDLGKIYRAKQELPTQSAMEKEVRHIWSQHIVGGIRHHWSKLNPDGRSSLCFAPGVKESLGIAHEFNRHGINAAHISSSSIYVDGKEYNSSQQSDRDEIFARSKDGTVPFISNRFVLREAIDLPWIEYLALACPIASLLSYLQTVGRGLRASPSTGKKECMISDHAGNIRLHESPNKDRDQDWLTYYYENEDKITKDRVEGLRDPDETEPEPITCPECGHMRRSGPKCLNPACGFEHSSSVRHVIQSTGELVPCKKSLFPKRRVKMKADTAKIWEQCYYRCRSAKKPMSFTQARALFVHENHYAPAQDLPLMPKNKSDWTRKITAVAHADLIPRNAPSAVAPLESGPRPSAAKHKSAPLVTPAEPPAATPASKPQQSTLFE